MPVPVARRDRWSGGGRTCRVLASVPSPARQDPPVVAWAFLDDLVTPVVEDNPDEEDEEEATEDDEDEDDEPTAESVVWLVPVGRVPLGVPLERNGTV